MSQDSRYSEIDIHRHAVIEASAGTGKTFTIVKLFLRLLTEKKIPIEKILVVTYTNRAASELKERLREEIVREYRAAGKEDPERQRILLRTLRSYQDIRVFTIHAFAQRSLGFLQPHYRLGNVSTGNEILREGYYQALRRDLVEILGGDLEEVLDLSDFPDYFRDKSRFESSVVSLLNIYYDHETISLFPEALSLETIPRKIKEEEEQDLLPAQVKSFLVQRAFLHARKLRRMQGEISYNDMIYDLATVLQTEEARESLSNLYSVGLIDEFQDTDPLQWEIFSRIFLVPDRTIIVVGDPKQSIYQFRGADVNTYLRAREEIQQAGGELYQLEYNYRSTRDLIEAANAFFVQTNFFLSDQFGYHAVQYGEKKRKEISPLPGRGAFNVVRLPEGIAGREAMAIYMEWIADEIVRLEESGVVRESFAVLVSKNRDGRMMQKALKRREIASLIQGEESLFQTSEARLVYSLLLSLATPSGANWIRVLLSDFFRIELETVLQSEIPAELEALHARWRETAEDGNLSLLLRDVLDTTGLLFSSFDQNLQTDERRYTNFRHLNEILTEVATDSNLSLAELVRWLAEKISEEKEETLQRIESEEPRVRILTMHSSKGLEFPVVFVVPGFTRLPSGDNDILYYDFSVDGERNFDFSKDPAHKSLHENQEEAQRRRLHYVAFTRAENIVYYPLFTKLTKEGKVNSSIAEVGRFLYDFLKEAVESKIAVEVNVESGESKSATDKESIFDYPGKVPPGAHYQPLAADLFRRALRLHSFSSLSREHGENKYFVDEENDLSPRDEIPAQLPVVQKSIEFVSGRETGVFLHALFEYVDFSLFRDMQRAEDMLETEGLSPLIEKLIRQYQPRLKGTEKFFRTRQEKDIGNDELAGLFSAALKKQKQAIQSVKESELTFLLLQSESMRLVYNMAKAELPGGAGSLADYSGKQTLRELSFTASASDSRVPAAAGGKNDFLTGSIDLVFQRDGDYYIADYKSNELGSYSEQEIAENVSEHYQLQIDIYREALQRYLRLRGSGRVKGVYYFYLRGLRAGTSSGIYFQPEESVP